MPVVLNEKRPRSRWFGRVFGFAAVALLVLPNVANAEEEPSVDEQLLGWMEEVTNELAAMGEDYRLESLEFYTLGLGRPGIRIHQEIAQWVPGDLRRNADGNNITYIVDQSGTTADLSVPAAEGAIDRAVGTWSDERCLDKLNIVKRADPGFDVTVLDFFFGRGFGFPFAADIVYGGWLPIMNFVLETLLGIPVPDVIAVTATFVFVDVSTGIPTDVDGDQFLDIAFAEVYFADSIVSPFPVEIDIAWDIDQPLPRVDVETVALHETGHGLAIGHFGPPPNAVMNPEYSGVRQETTPIDVAGMCTVWQSWPIF